ncbi:lytic polysaccharide monooxygenase [Streptomyces sp. N35]|uniref:lytic polysaccharide monooxygenase n=1 Tax=Streptomyces sp. N35 TaxID=2795730 RepID=UPI0018F74933|nr:lytic polysaccharide monooxygenase [Streptomyces sp. N35]
MNRKQISIATAVAASVAASVLSVTAAHGHGYVGDGGEGLKARAALKANTNLGPIQYEPQSLEGPKGFPAAGPADGKLASAGQAMATNLDEQSATRWVKQDVTTGPQSVNWTYTAPHKTTKWDYFMTKPGWDPNDKLDRGDFEHIQTVEHDGSAADTNPNHKVVIPDNRAGYHVIYAVWTVDDTANAFYNVIDVNVTGNGGAEDTEAPTAPGDLAKTDVTDNRVDLSWSKATDNVGVTQYKIFDGDKEMATVDGSKTSASVTGLKPETFYSFTVLAYDAAGNHSIGQKPLGVTTKPADSTEPDTEAPTAPSGLHEMGITDTTVRLMWNRSSDNVGVTEYKIFDGDKEMATVGGDTTSTTVTGLKPETFYSFTVLAYDAAGNHSIGQKPLGVTTKPAEEAPEHPNWDAKAAYSKGDRVTHNGSVYECVQSYQGNGDPNWIDAQSLWVKK